MGLTVRAMLAAIFLLASLAAAQAGGATITIDNFAFTPAEVTVAPGTAITWVNHDDIPHLVVGPDGRGLMKSPALDTDDQFTAVFDTPGTFGYFCSLHPHMQGTVTVR